MKFIYNSQVFYQFRHPCLRRDDGQGRNRLKKHVIPAPYQVRDKLQWESSILNKFIRVFNWGFPDKQNPLIP